jgi:hypothetical protein
MPSVADTVEERLHCCLHCILDMEARGERAAAEAARHRLVEVMALPAWQSSSDLPQIGRLGDLVGSVPHTGGAMNPAEAAKEFWATVDAVTEHKPVASRHEAASKVLKAHMVDKGVATYQGIHLVESPGGSRLDQNLVKAKYGDKLKDCMIDTIRRSLIPVKRPKAHAST